jgi:hypothetical protein
MYRSKISSFAGYKPQHYVPSGKNRSANALLVTYPREIILQVISLNVHYVTSGENPSPNALLETYKFQRNSFAGYKPQHDVPSGRNPSPNAD